MTRAGGALCHDAGMNYTEPRRGLPLRADPAELARAERRSFHRAVACMIRGHVDHEPATAVARRSFPDDARADWFVRAATAPIDTTSASALTRLQVSPLALLAPPSAAAQLFDRGRKLSFDGVTRYQIPSVQAHPPATFVSEGAPIPLVMAVTEATTIGPPSKLSFLASVSEELQRMTGPDDATVLIGAILAEAIARGLDAATFSTAAASSAQPAGLLAGATQLVPSVLSGTVADTIAADAAAFATFFASSNINSENMVWAVNPAQRWRLKMALGYAPSALSTSLPILMSPAIPAREVVAVVPEALYSYAGAIQIEISDQAAVHFADNPADIAVPGTPPVVAAPVRSAFQTASLIMKLRLRTTWCALPNAVAYMSGVNW
jgi:hypothetical protein